MNKKRPSKKQILKLSRKKCFFCDADDYDILDVHRIMYETDNNKYNNPANTLVVCCTCHRLIHVKKIVIDRKYIWSGPGYIVHYWKDGKEEWKPELNKN